MKIIKTSVCAVMFAMSCLAAVAHDHATGVVRERMEMMEGMAKRMKAIRERIDRKRDLAAIKADAEAIVSQAPHLVHLFPPGRQPEAYGCEKHHLAGVAGFRAQGERGEITILDGKLVVTYGKDNRPAPNDEGAALLAIGKVGAWQTILVETDVEPSKIEIFSPRQQRRLASIRRSHSPFS